MVTNTWSSNFTITLDDVEYLANVLVERETPMTTGQLARLIVEHRLEQERQDISEQYENARIYDPSQHYEIGERVVFSELDFAVGEVVSTRTGTNPAHGEFPVIQVHFEGAGKPNREFASELRTPHNLSNVEVKLPGIAGLQSADEILRTNIKPIATAINSALQKSDVLSRVAGFWFPRELVLDIDIGTLHLAEAVLDMTGGGPLQTNEIIEQIGGISQAPGQLQVFSLNLALSQDNRFDEVGPSGEVRWYLTRMEPEAVRNVPQLLHYKDIPYDEDLLTDEMIEIETELDDELTPIDFDGELARATTTLIYPHRRMGTLPLNAKMRQIFPTARTPRIYVELVDELDNQKYPGWVVHEHRFVYGLLDYYTKHRLPIGSYVTARLGEREDQIFISHEAYKPRTEYIQVFMPNDTQVQIENRKRAIGAAYDDLILIGVDDLASIDKLAKSYAQKPLASLLKVLVAELSKLSPQGTVHATTLYSAVNVLRRCPPGPIFATLRANPDFEDLGDHYWRLAE